MTILRTAARFAAAAATAFAVTSASAVTVTWTDWSSITALTAEGSMGLVDVEVFANAPMNGLSQINCGVNYWTEPNSADRPYTGGSVSNAPTACEQVGLNGEVIVSLFFSQPVDTLWLALLSVGQQGVPITYTFNHAFTIDSEGQGYWGNDTADGVVGGLNTTLTMREFHGLLRFDGPLTALSFITRGSENWHAFTAGSSQASAVSEPGTLALTALALLGAAAAQRRRRS